MNEEQEAKYLSKFGRFCPFCGSHELESGSMDIDVDEEGAYVLVTIVCKNCAKTWEDVYTK